MSTTSPCVNDLYGSNYPVSFQLACFVALSFFSFNLMANPARTVCPQNMQCHASVSQSGKSEESAWGTMHSFSSDQSVITASHFTISAHIRHKKRAPTLRHLRSCGESLASTRYSGAAFSAGHSCHWQFSSSFSSGPMNHWTAILTVLFPLKSHLRWEGTAKRAKEGG